MKVYEYFKMKYQETKNEYLKKRYAELFFNEIDKALMKDELSKEDYDLLTILY